MFPSRLHPTLDHRLFLVKWIPDDSRHFFEDTKVGSFRSLRLSFMIPWAMTVHTRSTTCVLSKRAVLPTLAR